MIAGATQYSVAENHDSAQVLGAYTAIDAKDGRPVRPRWSLSGPNGGDFVIDPVTGVLSFRGSPDYENPADSDGDNVYELTVETGDENNHTASLEITVTVTNLTGARASILGTVQVGRTLRAETSGINGRAVRPRLISATMWLAGGEDVEGATGSIYELTEEDEGKTIKV